MNTIKIEYLTVSRDIFSKIDLLPFEYFDLEENEVIEINSVPKFPQPFQYLRIDIADLVFLKLTIEIGDEKRIFNQTFWNKSENFITERIDIGQYNYRELILSIRVNDEIEKYETIRLLFCTDFILPIHHSIISTNKLGQETEFKYDTNIFINMIKQGKIL